VHWARRPTPWPDSGKNILLLERGDFLAREMDNRDRRPVFVDGKYISADIWYDGDGKPSWRCCVPIGTAWLIRLWFRRAALS
jgi:hypothetical protein